MSGDFFSVSSLDLKLGETHFSFMVGSFISGKASDSLAWGLGMICTGIAAFCCFLEWK